MRLPAGKKPNLIALLLAALAFLCLPGLLAFAQAGTLPSSKRSDTAYADTRPRLEQELTAAGLQLGNRIFLRITKEPAELTAYVEDAKGVYEVFRTWPVCAASGTLGPKLREGDGQAPEGFYEIAPVQMNPSSDYHLSFNLGFPNAYDRANGRTGSFLMVHGNCVSIGCFAMTDPVLDEIWTLMQAAFENGQTRVPVHIFPFPMTEANLSAHAGSENAAFWTELAPGWTTFETTGKVPKVSVSGRSYRVGATQ
ncbi:MAG: murein L,D-transpeptidase family protein [Hyphomonas sp.]